MLFGDCLCSADECLGDDVTGCHGTRTVTPGTLRCHTLCASVLLLFTYKRCAPARIGRQGLQISKQSLEVEAGSPTGSPNHVAEDQSLMTLYKKLALVPILVRFLVKPSLCLGSYNRDAPPPKK